MCRERKSESLQKSLEKPSQFFSSSHLHCDEEGTGQGARKEGQRVMSRWWGALGRSLPLFGASCVGGQQRETREKSRKPGRKLLSHDNQTKEQAPKQHKTLSGKVKKKKPQQAACHALEEKNKKIKRIQLRFESCILGGSGVSRASSRAARDPP